MKQRFKARELWLLAPFLLIGAAALFYWRWEQANPPGKRGMYVSKVERAPATPRQEATDVSHHVTVTLSHSWPQPRWWGFVPTDPYLLDPRQPTKPPQLIYGAQSDESFANGGLAMGTRGGKEVVFESQSAVVPGIISFDGINYQVEHHLNLRATSDTGEVVFKGLYRFKNSRLVTAQEVVRARGEAFPPIDKNPGMRLSSLKASPWAKQEIIGINGVLERSDNTSLTVVVEATLPLPSGKKQHDLKGYTIGVKDEFGSMFGHTLSQGKEPDSPEVALGQRQLSKVFDISIDETEKTRGRIIAQGELSMDERWPVPFEIKLPPRPPAKATAVPPSRGGKPVKR